jgi:uncharacterized protein YeaC (DUF1315 family)
MLDNKVPKALGRAKRNMFLSKWPEGQQKKESFLEVKMMTWDLNINVDNCFDFVKSK